MTDTYKTLLAQLAPSQTGFELTRPAANKKKFEDLVNWIDVNLENAITPNDLIAQSGLSMKELSTQFWLNTKLSPLQFIKELKKYKAEIELTSQPGIDNTYALFDPIKQE